MHILVVTDRFTPEVTAVSVRTLDHARVWTDEGHEVTIVTCAPNFPKGKLFSGYRNSIYKEEWIDGIRVVRLWSYLAPNQGKVRRTIDYLSFAFSVIIQCWRLPTPDVIVATSPPIFAALAGRVIASLKRRPWVFEVRDLWPASIHAVGISKSPVLRLVETMELRLYAHSTRVLVLTNSFRDDLMSRGVPDGKISVVRNGVDLERFSPDRISFDARDRLSIPHDRFLAGYVGTVGIAHGLECIIDAAEQCRSNTGICFLIMGEGAERKRLQDLAESKGLTNVIFHDFVPHDEIINYVAALDVSIVHLKPHPLFKTVIPSKIFESMALGVPIIMAVRGESADIVRQAKCGVLVPPGDPTALSNTVQTLATDSRRLAQLRNAGQQAARETFDRRVLAGKALECLIQAVEESR